MSKQKYGMTLPVVLVHGGAGSIPDSKVCDMVDGVRCAVLRGFDILSSGGSSVDAAQACVEYMESDPAFNAGRGAVLNSNGEVELDAIIMDGRNLNFGSVGAVKNILHPVALARKVMEKSRASMLVGEGAMQFAKEEGFTCTPTYDLLTECAIKSYKKFKCDPNSANLEFECAAGVGTVGAVVIDKSGNLASATSTGGTIGKPPGRLGDTPIPGGGGYADNMIGAVSATGRGESIMRVCLSHRILNLMEHGKSAQEATEQALNYMQATVGDAAGAITLSQKGDVGIYFITKRMPWAFKKGDERVCAGIDLPSF